MTLKDLSDKEIKTINGGTGYEFPIIRGVIDTLKDVINLVNRYLGLVGLGLWKK